MSLIQILLILTAVAFLIVYFGFFRSVLRDRLIAVVIFTSAVFAILFPDFTTRVANLVGVGRGTDLVLYLLVVGSLFAVVMLTTRLMNIEKALTEVVRQFAITNAERPQNND